MEESGGPRHGGELDRADDSLEERKKAKKELVDRVSQLFDQLLEQNPQAFSQIVRIQRSFSGQLPPPELYSQYEEILPPAERILTMAENEQDHRHKMNDGLLGLESRGQAFGFGIGVLALIAGVLLVYMGASVGGVFLMILAVSGLVGSFVVDRFLAKSEEKKEG